MGDEPKPAGQDPAAGGQDPSGGGAPATDPGQDPKSGQDPSAKDGQDPSGGLSPEAMGAELKRARREAAASRKAKEEAEAKVKQFEDEKLSEQERLQKKGAEDATAREKAEADLRDSRLERVAERLAVKAGITDPEDASLLVNRRLVEFGEDGQPTEDSVQAAVDDLKTRKPHLFKEPTPDPKPKPGSADGGARPAGGTDRAGAIQEAQQKGDVKSSIALKAEEAEERAEAARRG